MKPDVIVTLTDHTTLFKAQNTRVSEWLYLHYRLARENASGDTEIYVHPSRYKQIIEELRAAGFTVLTL